MKDDMSNLFKERFTGHGSPVDPGLWDAIQGQLGAGTSAAGEEGLKELFQDRFSGHELPVDPAVWANISSQLGHGVAATTAGSSLFGPLGWAAAGIGVLAIAGAAYLLGPSAEKPQPPTSTVERVAPSAEAEKVQEVDTPPEIRSEPLAEKATPDTRNGSSKTGPSTATQNVADTSEPKSPAEQEGAVPAPQVTEPTEGEGTEIVENIITELTTRVTEEVLAEAAKRQTLGRGSDTAKTQAPETAPVVDVVVEEALPKLYLQNVFTPNGDGVNDTYFPVVEPGAFDRIMLRVYDVRNDRLVFNSNTNEPWTGDGCLDGYYLVAVEAMTPDGRLVTEGKVVWLNRNFQY